MKPLDRVLEVGFGESPVTAIEFRDAIREGWPDVEFLAVDNEVSRVELARGSDIEVASVEGFEIPGGRWDLIRAMNVLRAYQPDEVSIAWQAWSSRLAPHGRLIEGTTDPDGHLGSVVEVGADGEPRRLVFVTDFERGFAPLMFRDWLPRRWRRGSGADEPVLVFLQRWHAEFLRLHVPGGAPRRTFERVAEAMDCVWSADVWGASLEWPVENLAALER